MNKLAENSTNIINDNITKINKIILTFILQSESYETTSVNSILGNECRSYIPENFDNLKTKIGLSSRGYTRYNTTYIAFIGNGQDVKKGIYPVLLYATDSKQIIIAYGISIKDIPDINWEWDKMGVINMPKKLSECKLRINGENINAQNKYGTSYLFSYTNVQDFIEKYKDKNVHELSENEIQSIIDEYSFNFGRDLITIIKQYKLLFEDSKSNRELKVIPSQSNIDKINDDKDFSISELIETINKTNLIYSDEIIKRYVYSLLTKPFVILSGLSGSGKTQLALSVALSLVDSKDQICFVSVGADWTNREPLLGYPNALKKGDYVKPESGVLQIILEANKNPNKPYFLILDEMNLSYVERYFADFLSTMEAKGAHIKLWDNSETNTIIPNSIELPKNLFITGTINVDETTYMFSPKILDRANVIEFTISANDMNKFLESSSIVDISLCEMQAKNMAKKFVEIAKKHLPFSTDIKDILLQFFQPLKDANAEFGYRTATEISRFILLSKNDLGLDKAIDAVIVQKLLPKLHGNRRKVAPVLINLWELCTGSNNLEIENTTEILKNAKYPLAANKVLRMYNIAITNGFTSFAEA